ncbi:MAG: hypothetical protein A2W72_10590 [Burkholderiales bacterium RIFCSPLOWO2_12_67_14]|nr:MAG: hypothetical protein A3I64_23595 [Burkholderiales bacterium RIFCSPLOWO2_02_FULL_67_64]OGB42208.1 MAG: hypothetical protein A2W72_10590 [Burkholderiales bacterium RIFCSPLOWO2_12_67_14]OGB53475.1 MAG: hypothetical protein A3E51_10510 [Burkholderiales bacterium RIFCSPHIGHO2_12_FULL_67_38]OGB80588.1 MAG: hypothetical protein A3G82_00265 [Burkholderiales bacterium RIFCSPLOWO2_12_FULL_67_210]
MKRSRLTRWALWLWASPNTLIGLVLGLLLLPLGARLPWAVLSAAPTVLAFMLLSTYNWA